MRNVADFRKTYGQVHVEWTIENFFDLPTRDNYSLNSPEFTLSDSVWHLRIYIDGETRLKSAGWTSVYLWKETSKEECCVAYKIGIKKGDGSEIATSNGKSTFAVEESGRGFNHFFQRSSLKNDKDIFLSDGSLTVFCTARIDNTKDEQSQATTPYGTATLSENMKDLYISRRFTDATIVVQGREFPAHRNILATRSTVFSSMFENDMTEKSSGRVEIADCDPDSFEAFLLFLYTGKLDGVSSENALTLYKTADKYDLQELKEECVFCMSRELSVDSVCNVVHLAVTHNEINLLKAATEFFIGNAEAIIKTIKWRSFLTENFSLGNELILKLLESQKKSDD